MLAKKVMIVFISIVILFSLPLVINFLLYSGRVVGTILRNLVCLC